MKVGKQCNSTSKAVFKSNRKPDVILNEKISFQSHIYFSSVVSLRIQVLLSKRI